MVSALHSWQCGICHHVFHAPGRCPRCATSRFGDARGLGEQPSITDRDPGDESRSVDRQIIGELRDYQGELSVEIVIGRARIAALEAENAKLRADLAKWSRSQTVPEGSFW